MRVFVLISFICTIILALRHDPTNTQEATQAPMNCNNCCQGPIGSQGTPGIPGVPGNISPNGDRGDSVKGEDGPHSKKGDTGDPALKGDGGPRGSPGKVGPMEIAGPEGPSGDRGMKGNGGPRGPRSNTGPMGIPGPRRSPGLPGVNGQKGESSQTQLSAFSAARSSDFTPSSNGQALPFEQVHTHIGDDFDAASGRITCSVSGLYLFTYMIVTYVHDPTVCLYKDNEKINCVYRNDQNKWEESTNAAVLRLSPGEQMWPRCQDAGEIIESASNLYTSFSGVILHQL